VKQSFNFSSEVISLDIEDSFLSDRESTGIPNSKESLQSSIEYYRDMGYEIPNAKESLHSAISYYGDVGYEGTLHKFHMPQIICVSYFIYFSAQIYANK
jgi:hypothetical protein